MHDIRDYLPRIEVYFNLIILAYVWWPAIFRPELNREKEYYYREAIKRLKKIIPRWILTLLFIVLLYKFVLNSSIVFSLLMWGITIVCIIPGVFGQAMIWDMRSTSTSKGKK